MATLLVVCLYCPFIAVIVMSFSRSFQPLFQKAKPSQECFVDRRCDDEPREK
jgi:ABC-type spermidine/putrescine transport system permease subunit II